MTQRQSQEEKQKILQPEGRALRLRVFPAFYSVRPMVRMTSST